MGRMTSFASHQSASSILERKGVTLIDLMANLGAEANQEDAEHTGPRGGDLHWLNWAVEAIWPETRRAVSKRLREVIEEALKDGLPSVSGKLVGIKTFDLGDHPPMLGPVDVRQVKARKHPGVEFTIGFEWNSTGQFEIEMGTGLTIGIRRVTVAGDVNLTLRPVLDTLPIVCGIQVTMIAPPSIGWELTGLAQAVAHAGIERHLKNAITDLLLENLVLPNRLFVHWLHGREHEFDITEMQSPKPEALVRVGITKARGLKTSGMHLHLGSDGGCNPSARISIGHKAHQTKVLHKTTEPVWGDDGWCDFLMFTPNQLLTLELWDESFHGRHTVIGELLDDKKEGYVRKVSLMDLLQRGSGEWWTLYEKTKEGHNHHQGDLRPSGGSASIFHPGARCRASSKEKTSGTDHPRASGASVASSSAGIGGQSASSNSLPATLGGGVSDSVLKHVSASLLGLAAGHSESDHKLKEVGAVCIEFVLYSLVPEQHQVEPKQHKGKTDAEAVVSIQLHGLRGLAEPDATGARIKCSLSGHGTTVSEWSHQSKFVDATLETPQANDIAVQRLVEYLSLKGSSNKEIQEVSGLCAEQVRRIVEQKPSFNTKWNQSLHFPIRNPTEAVVQLQLMVHHEEGKGLPPVELRAAISIREEVFPEPGLKYKKIVTLARVKQTQPQHSALDALRLGHAGVHHKKDAHLDGPFELDMSVQVRYLDEVKDERGDD